MTYNVKERSLKNYPVALSPFLKKLGDLFFKLDNLKNTQNEPKKPRRSEEALKKEIKKGNIQVTLKEIAGGNNQNMPTIDYLCKLASIGKGTSVINILLCYSEVIRLAEELHKDANSGVRPDCLGLSLDYLKEIDCPQAENFMDAADAVKG